MSIFLLFISRYEYTKMSGSKFVIGNVIINCDSADLKNSDNLMHSIKDRIYNLENELYSESSSATSDNTITELESRILAIEARLNSSEEPLKDVVAEEIKGFSETDTDKKLEQIKRQLHADTENVVSEENV